MGIALQLLFTGVGVGSIYALVALGFVLIYRATNAVNFAQGDFAMLGAFSMVVLCIDLGLPYWLGILITVPGMALAGALFNLGVYYPLRHRSFLPVIISTIGASILLENGVLAIYGPRPQSLPGLVGSQGFSFGTGVLRQPVPGDPRREPGAVRPAAPVFRAHAPGQEAAGHLAGQGDGEPSRHSRCSHDHDHLRLQRHPGRDRGILVAPILFVSVSMGSSIALKAFAASIVGGFGNVTGAIVGGLALGVVETFGAAYISVPYKDAFAFLVLFVFLLVRPQGIFGERVSEKA